MDTYRDCTGETYDIVHSPDDEGFYAQRWSDDATSKVYKGKARLEADLRTQSPELDFTR